MSFSVWRGFLFVFQPFSIIAAAADYRIYEPQWLFRGEGNKLWAKSQQTEALLGFIEHFSRLSVLQLIYAHAECN